MSTMNAGPAHESVSARRASVATDATSSPGSTGLARCISNPLRNAFVRSSDRAKAVSAAAGIRRIAACLAIGEGA